MQTAHDWFELSKDRKRLSLLTDAITRHSLHRQTIFLFKAIFFFRVLKLKCLRLSANVTCIGEKKNSRRILVANFMPIKKFGVQKIILNYIAGVLILRKHDYQRSYRGSIPGCVIWYLWLTM
jgi:hypothetical protein